VNATNFRQVGVCTSSEKLVAENTKSFVVLHLLLQHPATACFPSKAPTGICMAQRMEQTLLRSCSAQFWAAAALGAGTSFTMQHTHGLCCRDLLQPNSSQQPLVRVQHNDYQH